jgi:hypothetical protein
MRRRYLPSEVSPRELILLSAAQATTEELDSGTKWSKEKRRERMDEIREKMQQEGVDERWLYDQ